VEFELEVPTPREREEYRRRGIDLPRASAQGADPRRRNDYVDRRLTAVGFGIYIRGYVLYLEGVEQPVFVPESHFDFGATRMEPSDLAIFPTRNEASANVPYGPWAPGQAQPYAYYWGAGGLVVAPTLFTPDTTPRVIETALAAQRELAAQVQEELTVLALSIVGAGVLRIIIRRLVGAGGRPLRPSQRPPREIGEEIVRRNGNSVRRSLPELNRAGLSQEEAAEALEAMYRATGRDVANRVRMPDGNLVVTSRVPGPSQPVNIVSPNGQITFGRADLSLTTNPNAPMSVSNLVPD
jgi:hypothetical protein